MTLLFRIMPHVGRKTQVSYISTMLKSWSRFPGIPPGRSSEHHPGSESDAPDRWQALRSQDPPPSADRTMPPYVDVKEHCAGGVLGHRPNIGRTSPQGCTDHRGHESRRKSGTAPRSRLVERSGAPRMCL
jgi:hypothetical protein